MHLAAASTRLSGSPSLASQRLTSPGTCSSANAPSKHTCATLTRNSTSTPNSSSPGERPSSASEPLRTAVPFVSAPKRSNESREERAVAGLSWTIEENFQAGNGLTGLDEHQVRSRASWHRWVTLAMVAGASRFAGQQKGLRGSLREVTVLIGFAQHPGTHHQPGLPQQSGDTLWLQPVEVERDRVTQRLRQVQQSVAGLERQQNKAARGQHPAEPREDVWQSFLRDVNDRVPGHDAAEAGFWQVQGQHRTHVEPQVWVRPPGHRHHLRGQVDAERG